MELQELYSIAESPQLSGLPLCGRTAKLPKSAPALRSNKSQGMILPGGGDAPVPNPQKLPSVELQNIQSPSS